MADNRGRPIKQDISLLGIRSSVMDYVRHPRRALLVGNDSDMRERLGKNYNVTPLPFPQVFGVSRNNFDRQGIGIFLKKTVC